MRIPPATHLVAHCDSQEQARALRAAIADILSGLGLKLSGPKTRIVCVAGGDESFQFLGFHHQMVPTRKRPDRRHLARWPTDKAMVRARTRIREMTGRNRCHVPTEVLVGEINQFLRGWGQYYRLGQSTRRFHAIDEYVVEPWLCCSPNGTAEPAEVTASSTSCCQATASD